MKNRCLSGLVFLGILLLGIPAHAVEYLTARPLIEVVKTPVAACGNLSRDLLVPVIQWGPDAALSVANGNSKRSAPGSIFAGKKLDITLARQDDFLQQLSDYLSCKTPFLRGTADMVSLASELLARDPRTVPVPLTQLSWSHGGDAIVARENIKSPKDLCGKTIAIQFAGPHMYFIQKILSDAGCKLSDIRFKWVKDLTQDKPTAVSPMLALKSDPSIDAVTVIIPDALALTSNGKVGTGSDGDSVRGAHILVTSDDATTVIADILWVRKDIFDARKTDVVMPLVNGFMQGAERLRDLMKTKGAGYKEATTAAADLLFDSTSASGIKDFVDLYSGAEVVGFAGNVKFFTDQAYLRSFEKLVREIQPAFIGLGLLQKTTPIEPPSWDWNVLSVGLADTRGVELPRFNAAAVQREVETRAKQPTQEGVLFPLEVFFGAQQNTFPADQYAAQFDRTMELAQTYGGALMSIEGNSDPTSYLQCKKASTDPSYRQTLADRLRQQQPPSSIEEQCLSKNPGPMELSQLRQSARNLSQSRANAVKDSLIAYARAKGVTLDTTQFGIVGLGINQPNTPSCRYDAAGDIDLSCYPATVAEWNATRRVVFKIIRVKAESDVFRPL